MSIRLKCAIATISLLPVLGAQVQKQHKNRDEFDLHSQVAKDFAGRDYAKALAALDAWNGKYPDSAFADERLLLYVQAYAAAGQPAKAIDAAAPLLSRDQAALFPNPDDRLRFLYVLATAVARVAEPTAGQQAAGAAAAEELAASGKAPAGATVADLQNTARIALVHLALAPAIQAMKKKDCPAAAEAARRAVASHPESVQAVWHLASAHLCLSRSQPDHAAQAIYQFARAAVLDPVKGMVDPKWQQETVNPYLEKIYSQYHGADPEGLKQLKEVAATSALPPPGFTIKSKAEIELERQADFESRNPELALWQKIRAALSAEDGAQYFESIVKGAAVPQLIGTLAAATPSCRPTELTVVIGSAPEIRIRLTKAIQGRPELDTEIRWEGVPLAFSKQPFLLTMEVEPTKISGLKVQPCAPPVRKK